ncbi:MAG: DUF58 domain-containing protein [Clostridia bacterium]|nr:DUF58 domain-containing protein [Clostridia bacterium]
MTALSVFFHWVCYLLALCGISAFAVNYTGWFSSYLFWLTISLPLFSLLLSLWPLFSVTLYYDAPDTLHRGESASLFIGAAYRRRFSCPYCLPITLSLMQEIPSRTQSPSGISTQKSVRPAVVRCRFAPYPLPPQSRGNKPVRKRGTYAARDRRVLGGEHPLGGRHPLGGGLCIPLDTAHTTVIRTEIRSAMQSDFLGLFLLPLPRRSLPPDARVSDIVVLPNTKKPLGRLRMWETGAQVMVPTQRPTEQYEIRDYRAGDTLRSVHWKLSAKTDDLLVRESVEPVCNQLAVTVDRPADPDTADAVYDALDWVLRALCVRERVSSVTAAWVNAAGRTCTETISDPTALDKFYLHLLSDGIPRPEDLSPHAFAAVYKMCGRGYHLDAECCVPNAKDPTPKDTADKTSR